MTDVCKIMSAMENKDRGQSFPFFSSRTGGHHMNSARSRFKTEKYKFLIQQVAALPMDVWVRRLQAFSGTLDCR